MSGYIKILMPLTCVDSSYESGAMQANDLWRALFSSSAENMQKLTGMPLVL